MWQQTMMLYKSFCRDLVFIFYSTIIDSTITRNNITNNITILFAYTNFCALCRYIDLSGQESFLF